MSEEKGQAKSAVQKTKVVVEKGRCSYLKGWRRLISEPSILSPHRVRLLHSANKMGRAFFLSINLVVALALLLSNNEMFWVPSRVASDKTVQ